MGIRDLSTYLSRLWVQREFTVGWSFRFGWPTKKMNRWKYFADDEVIGLEPELVSKLDTARHISGVPFKITSGRRSSGDNSVLNGAVADSSHLTGKAVDLAVGGSREYFLMMKGLLASGFRRIGQYMNVDGNDVIHLHVDIDETKDQDVLFSKKEEN